MRTFGHLMRMLQKNWKILLGFELLYKLVSFTISIPLFGQLFYGIMRLNGYGYITIDNVFEFASSGDECCTCDYDYFSSWISPGRRKR